VGTAGSTMLVLQTILFPLALAKRPSTLILEGGTHNIHAPPFDFIERAFLPIINRLGPNVSVRLERPGFYPAGGGRVVVEIAPTSALQGFDLLERGALVSREIRALVAHLPTAIAHRETLTICDRLGWPRNVMSAEVVDESPGPGNIVLVELGFEHVTEVFSAVGQKGVPAEDVAAGCADEVEAFLAGDAPVGPHLADQLLLPIALAGEGSFRTGPLTDHSRTQLETICRFLDVDLCVIDEGHGIQRIEARRPVR
jgi:RNA 3'-terminal phosphate cyclase (ATP)